MAGKTVDLAAITFKAYPNAVDCTKGHVGKPGLTWFLEQDDDRYHIMVLERCSHCFMPCGKSDYANAENQDRYYNDLPPLPQEPES